MTNKDKLGFAKGHSMTNKEKLGFSNEPINEKQVRLFKGSVK
jgi:hypothetical protein